MPAYKSRLFKKIARSTSALLIANFGFQYSAIAQSAFDLDLSSTERTVNARYAGEIIVGGVSQSIAVNDLITPAERIALYQSNNGGQNLILSSQGSAIGGTFNVTDRFSPTGSFVIPSGVTAIQTAASLNLTGNLTNNGTLYAVPQNMSAVINAANIMNNVGAIISTMPPVSTGIISPGAIDLSLIATMNIVNAGQIISSANLNLTAGGNIVNSLPTGVSAAQPVMQAMQNLNLITGALNPSGLIANSGLINSIAGNINFSTSNLSNILVNNTGGNLIAQMGAINIRDAAFTEKFNFDLIGGDVLSKTLNIWSGTGTTNVDVQNLSGLINASTGVMHLNAMTPDLNLGSIRILGDPTFFNQGNISINNAIQAVGPLAIIASGNITSTATGSINTTQAAGAGGAVLIMAGTNFTTPGSGSSTTAGQNGGAGDNSSTLTILGGNSTGGFVDLSQLTTPGGGALSALQTTAASGAGGNVTIIAFAGSNAGSGVITTAGMQGGILTGGGGGSNGNVEMIAGATSGTAINAGDINTSGTAVNLAGEIILLGATPTVANMTILNGLVSTNATISASGVQNSSISAGNLSTNAVPVTIVAGNNITLNGSISTQGIPAFVVNGPGGNLALLAGGNISTGTNATTISTNGGTSSHGGNVLFLAGATLQANLTHTFNPAADTIAYTVTVPSSTATGGLVDMTGGGTFNLSSLSTKGFNAGAGFAGGNVQIVAFAGSTANSGTVTFPTSSSIVTSGLSNGNSMSNVINTNGNVSIYAGNNSGASTTSISLGAITTYSAVTGSNGGAGNVSIATAQATTGLPLVYQNAAISSGTLDFSALTSSSIALQGNITAEGGSVLLPAPALGVNTTQTTSILVQSGQNLSLAGNISNLNATLPAGNLPGGCGINCNGINSSTITLTAAGTLTFSPTGSLISTNAAAQNPVNGQGINGGSIVLQAQSFAGQASITANATGGFQVNNGSGGNGGSISITSTGNTAASTINFAPTSITVSALGDNGGGNGGMLSVTSGADISIDGTGVFPIAINPAAGSNSLVDPLAGSNSFINSGNGGILNLTAAGNLAVTGSGLDASGAQSAYNDATMTGNPGGSGGQINISVNSATAFNIGAAAAPTNGIQGILSANGNAIGPGMTSAFGAGGSISVTNLGSGGITVQTGSLSVQAADANSIYHAGTGGRIQLQGATVLTMGSLDASGGGSSAAKSSGTGGFISVSTNNSTSFEVGTPTTNGITGSVTANGNVVGSGTPPVGPATIPVPNYGSGGTIILSNTGTGGVYIDSAGGISVNAASASINMAAGNGGVISLQAPNGPVLSEIPLAANGGAASSATDVDAGVGGSIFIVSNSSSPFVIGTLPGSPVNGVATSITADGYSAGTISVQNLGSGGIQVGANTISLLANSNANVQNTAGYGGSLTLSAPTGPIAVTGGLDVSGASGSNFGGIAGSISLVANSSTPFLIGSGPGSSNSFVTGNLTANGGTGIAGNGDGGSISVVNMGSGGINVATNSILVTAPDATLSGYAGAGGNITLQAPGGPVVITGSLNANGGLASKTSAYSAGFGGSITIVENDTNAFDIGGASVSQLSANGWSGGTITVTNSGVGGITVQPNGISVTAGAAQYQFPANPLQLGQNGTPGPGGTVVLNAVAGLVTVNGTIDVSGGAIFQQTPTNVLNAGGTTLDVGSTLGFAVGQTVTITDGTNTETQVIQTVTANTSVTVAPLLNSYGANATVSAYSNTQVSTNPVAINVLQNATNTLPINAGTTVIDMSDTTGYVVGQTVFLSNPEFTQTATNIPAVQANSTINVADTSGFGIGQTVQISGNGLSESHTITGVNPGVSITVDVTNTYTVVPTLLVAAVSETQTISAISPNVSITLAGAGTTNTYAVTTPVLSVTSILDVPSTQGFIQNQAVSISSGNTSEVQFIQSITPTQLVFTNLANNYPTPPTVSAFTNNGTVSITSLQGVSQAQGTSINANTLNINASAGTVGTSASPLQVNILPNGTPGTLSVASVGAATVTNSSTTMALGTIQAGSFLLSSNGSIFANAPINSPGAVTLLNTNTTTGDIFVNNLPSGPAPINAGGLLLLQNNNLAGLINVASPINGGGGVILTNGPAPGSPVAGTTPANVTASSSGGFNVFFGANGLTAGPGVTVGASNGNVVFNGATPGSITLAGGISINTTASTQALPPVTQPPVLGSAPPQFTLPPGTLGLGASRPFGTIISTDQTPESNPEQSGTLAAENPTLTLTTLANKQMDSTQRLLYFGPNFENTETLSIINIPTGNGLVIATKHTEINTGLAKISLEAGSAVLIFQSATEIAILNLHDERQSAVFAIVDGQKIEIPIGRQLVLTSRNNADFDDINPSSIGYRELSSFSLGSKKAYMAEFSSLSALTSVLKTLNTANKAQQAIAQRMLKSAAAIFMLGQQQKKPIYKSSSKR